jgi:hypothetical protein
MSDVTCAVLPLVRASSGFDEAEQATIRATDRPAEP